MQFRPGTDSDLDAILALFDANIEWLVSRGSADQWGSKPWSGDPKKVAFVRELLTDGVLTIAEIDNVAVGTSLVTDHPMPYVPAAAEPERYLKLLITSPAHRGKKIGHRLIDRARDLAVSEGIGLLRVDCWSGGDKQLVRYYARAGFTPTEVIEVRPGTSVQVFEWRPPDQGSTSDLFSASAGT